MTRSTLTALLLVALFFAAPAAQAEVPRAPEGTEILLQGRILPEPAETRRWIARVKGYALVERGLEYLSDEYGLDVERDILSWVEGTAMAAILRTGDESPLSRMVRNQELVDQYDECESHLGVVHSAILSYSDIQGAPPATLQDLVPDYVDEEFELSTVRYTRDGKNWTVTCVFPEGSELAAAATPPTLDQDYNRTEGKRPEMPDLNLVVAVKVTDPALASRKVREVLTKLGEAPAGEGPITLPDDDMVLDVRNGWMIVADDRSLIPPTSAVLSGTPPVPANLSRMLAKVPRNPNLFLYVDVPDIVGHWRGLDLQDETLRQALGAVKGAIVATYSEERTLETDSFLALDPPPGHPLAALLKGGSDNRLPVLRKVPWSVSYVDVLEVTELWRAADDLSKMHPYLQFGIETVRSMTEETLGLSIEKDLLPASTGELAINLEAVDILSAGILMGFEEYQDMRKDPPMEEEAPPEPESPEAPAPESTETPAPEGTEGTEDPGMEVPPPPGVEEDDLDFLKNIPVTLVVGLRSGPARQRILQLLEERMGADGRRIPWRGGEIRQRKDRALAYTLRGDYLIISVGSTLRLMKAMSDGMTGQVPPLAELNSYQDFRSGLKGRVLAFRHTKADAMYSIAKGLLLFLGAEFRHEADELGLWRDAYAAWTVEPDGLRLRGALYATDQVP